ncbi:MAG: hypothetical protein EBU46_09400 [Nitrosomonadaceae bacterium]|nr:hypothetical protein [Nitrosomonadaceae bacterium]
MQIIDLDTTTDTDAALQQVIRFTGAKPSTLGILACASLKGYEVEAKSGAQYFVETATLRTFDVPSGRFICLEQDGRVTFDAASSAQLAARLLALYNDIPSKLWPAEE